MQLESPAETRKHAIFIEQFDPDVPTHGRPVRLLGLARAAAQLGYEVEVFCFAGGDKTIPGPVKIVSFGKGTGIVQATFGAFQMFSGVRRSVSRAPMTYVQIENPRLILCAMLLHLRGIPFSYEVHVFEEEFQRSTSRSRWLKAWILIRAERWLFRHAARLVVLSKEDEARLLDRYAVSRHRILVLPHCVSEEWLSAPVPPSTIPRAVFVGSWKHPANRDSVRFIVDELAPRLAKKRPGVSLVVVGSGIPKDLTSMPNVEIQRDVNSPMPSVDGATVCLAPVFMGSGVRTKILEYFARGRAVVANGVAMQGLEVIPGVHYAAAETPDEFVARIIELLEDPRALSKLGDGARQLVAESYSWEACKGLLDRLLQSNFSADLATRPGRGGP